jgi:hypothetical protein
MFSGSISVAANLCIKPERRPLFPNPISRERIGVKDRPVAQDGSNFM